MEEYQQTERETLSVLLVDDEENILKSLQRLLMDEENMEIYTANSGEEGLKILPELTNLGLIVSDQRMPGMTGALFLEKALAIRPDAIRIILTGYADVSAAVDAINRGGAWRYLAKPWDDGDLVRVIREGAERYRIMMENRRLNSLVLKQKQELEEWNRGLKQRVIDQTVSIRKQNAELHELLARGKANYSAIIAAFAGLVEMHGGRLRQHSHNVTELSLNAARELGIAGDELETIRIAALLHDIGKIGIPGRVLLISRESMKADEFKQYQQHAVRGQVVIDAIEDLRASGVLIRHHHENFDGSGFPDKLKAEGIPLGARIIAFADYIDNASESFTDDIADKVLACAGFVVGKQLDPSLYKVFRKVTKYTYNDLDDLALRIRQNAHAHECSVTEKNVDMIELELNPTELKTGMILSKNIFSGSGVLLLRRGIALDAKMIEDIERNYEIDSPATGVFVKVPRMSLP